METGAAGGSLVGHETPVATLEHHLTAIIRGHASITHFEAWWERAEATDLLAALTPEADPRGSKAVILCRLAVDDYRSRRIGEEDLLDLLTLAREALRG